MWVEVSENRGDGVKGWVSWTRPRGPGLCDRIQGRRDAPTSPMRYLRLPQGIRGSRCRKAFVRYVFRISMQTLEAEGRAQRQADAQSLAPAPWEDVATAALGGERAGRTVLGRGLAARPPGSRTR